MAETKDSRGKEPAARKRDPAFSQSPDGNGNGAGEGAPAGMRRPAAKKKKSWFQENQKLVIGLAIGVGVLAIVLVLGFTLGWFGKGSPAKATATPSPVAVASQPAAPQSPPSTAAASPAQAAPFSGAAGQTPPSGQVVVPGQGIPPGQAVVPGQPPVPDVKKDEPKKPPLPDDVAKWKPEHYQRARHDNDVKLLPAIIRLGEKFPGNEKAAQVLVSLLKPLPPEKPAETPPPGAPGMPPMPGSAPPAMPGGQPPPAFGSPPGVAPPAMPGAQPPPGFGMQPGGAPPPGVTPPAMPGGQPQPGFGSQPGAAPPTMPGGQPPAFGTPPAFGAPPAFGSPPNMAGANPIVSGPRPYTPADLTKLVETIIDALGCNGSELARSTLEQVMAGTFATDDDKTAVEATLKALMAHPKDEYDALLLRVLTAAEALRSADHQGPWPAKDLQARAFELVKQSAPSGLRTKLACLAVGTRTKLDPKDPTTEFLLAANPLNCGAQLLFYEKPDVKKNKELKTTLEQQFTGYGSTALARCLGISTEGIPATAGFAPPMGQPGGGLFGGPAAQPGGAFGGPPVAPGGGFRPPQPPPPTGVVPVAPGEPAKAVDVDLGAQLAGQLWSGQFRALIEPQVAELHALDKQPQLFVLAATIPEDSTRAVLAKLLKKHWEEGPKALETAGLIDRVIADPGLLPIIKMSVSRKESPSTSRASDPVATKRGRGAGLSTPPGGGGRNEALQKKQQAEKDWMDVSAKLASGWCKRFGAAASAKEASDASDKAGGDAGEAKLPSGFEMAPAAKIIAAHRVVLPGAAPASFSQAQPSTLEVYYVRAEESSKPKKATAYYIRHAAARPADVRTFEGKTWIDTHRQAPQKDRQRSVDVLITRPERATPAAGEKSAAEDEVDLTIEVLIIEIKDPTKD